MFYVLCWLGLVTGYNANITGNHHRLPVIHRSPSIKTNPVAVIFYLWRHIQFSIALLLFDIWYETPCRGGKQTQSNTTKFRGSNTYNYNSLSKVFTALEMPSDNDQVDLDQDTPLPNNPPAGVCLLPPGLCSSSTESQRRRWRSTAGLQGLPPRTAGPVLPENSVTLSLITRLFRLFCSNKDLVTVMVICWNTFWQTLLASTS